MVSSSRNSVSHRTVAARGHTPPRAKTSLDSSVLRSPQDYRLAPKSIVTFDPLAHRALAWWRLQPPHAPLTRHAATSSGEAALAGSRRTLDLGPIPSPSNDIGTLTSRTVGMKGTPRSTRAMATCRATRHVIGSEVSLTHLGVAGWARLRGNEPGQLAGLASAALRCISSRADHTSLIVLGKSPARPALPCRR
jgi:hypothetical protein